MIVFPNAKINIGLHVLSKRHDGFHDIQTLMYPVGWRDALEIIPVENGRGPDGSKVAFTQSGLELDIALQDNLCVRAAEVYDRAYGIPPVQMHLHKVVPSGAGLGGGSSDAAHVLLLLEMLFGRAGSTDALAGPALELGSDCPFFLSNKPSLAEGRGERLTPMATRLAGMHVVIVKPHVKISTAWAYAETGAVPHQVGLDELLSAPPDTWRGKVANDFEPSVFDKYSSIGDIRDQMYRAGAVFASMTGTGSAVYGIFSRPAARMPEFPGCVTWQGMLE